MLIIIAIFFTVLSFCSHEAVTVKQVSKFIVSNRPEELKDVQCTTLLWNLLELGRQVGAKEETSFWCLGWESRSPLLISLCKG